MERCEVSFLRPHVCLPVLQDGRGNVGRHLDLGRDLGVSLKLSREFGITVTGTAGSGRDPEDWENIIQIVLNFEAPCRARFAF